MYFLKDAKEGLRIREQIEVEYDSNVFCSHVIEDISLIADHVIIELYEQGGLDDTPETALLLDNAKVEITAVLAERILKGEDLQDFIRAYNRNLDELYQDYIAQNYGNYADEIALYLQQALKPSDDEPEVGDQAPAQELVIQSHEIETDQFSWVDDNTLNVSIVEHTRSGQKVAIAHAMSAKAKKIMASSALRNDIDEIFLERVSGAYFIDAQLLRYRPAKPARYKGCTESLRCYKVTGPNCPRSYFMKRNVAALKDDELSHFLSSQKIEDILLLIGRSDKNHQTELMQELTGRTRKNLRGDGFGDVQ